ncbi:MAG: hypothetical protein ACTSXZ_03295 [Alphaproteobacteria bacterium]
MIFHKNFWPLWVAALLALTLVVGVLSCADEDDDDNDADDDWADDDAIGDDDVDDDYDDFLDALPDPESLMLTIPGADEVKTQTLGETPVLYDFTVDQALDVNDYILEVLSVIDEVTSFSPTSFDGTNLIWGPWQSSGLSPVTERFTMTNIADNAYEYKLEWRDKFSTEEEDWVLIWSGNVEASATTERRGVGEFNIDYTAAKEMWSSRVDATGEINVDYDTLTDGREIDIEFDDFLPDDEEIPMNAVYEFDEQGNLSGYFAFDAWVDIGEDEEEWGFDPEDDVAEHFWVVTQWQSTGDGRGDALITDGNVPDIHYVSLTAGQLSLTECWDDHFETIYEIGMIYWDDGGATPWIEEAGNPDDCAFEEDTPQVN